ncbi:MAG: helix-turn-helix domain-containing protein [Cohaesibacter sp.]|nr:helix-turn-helix domain-containing protein [Cohaesibacter sp.]
MSATSKVSLQEDDKVARRQAVGRWLKGLREDAGLSQRDLAKKIQVEYYTFISQIESGRGRIPPERYVAWSEALDVDAKKFAYRMLEAYEPTTYMILCPQEVAESR